MYSRRPVQLNEIEQPTLSSCKSSKFVNSIEESYIFCLLHYNAHWLVCILVVLYQWQLQYIGIVIRVFAKHTSEWGLDTLRLSVYMYIFGQFYIRTDRDHNCLDMCNFVALAIWHLSKLPSHSHPNEEETIIINFIYKQVTTGWISFSSLVSNFGTLVQVYIYNYGD